MTNRLLPLSMPISIEPPYGEQQEKEGRGIVRPHRRKPEIAADDYIFMCDSARWSGPAEQPQWRGATTEAERMSAIGRMACSISHDMRHSLSAIYANAEFLERGDISGNAKASLLEDIQSAVLALTRRIDSLLHFGITGRDTIRIRERISLVVERAVSAVKCHPDGRNVSIACGKFSPATANVDVGNLESAIYNLLLNACQAATGSAHAPEVKVELTEAHRQVYVRVSDNGPGIPGSVRKTLFDPFVTAGKPNGTGLGLTLACRIAEEHGGSVCVEKSGSEGSIFTLKLTKN